MLYSDRRARVNAFPGSFAWQVSLDPSHCSYNIKRYRGPEPKRKEEEGGREGEDKGVFVRGCCGETANLDLQNSCHNVGDHQDLGIHR